MIDVTYMHVNSNHKAIHAKPCH